MGYTHYWRNGALSARVWEDNFLPDVRRALDMLPPFVTTEHGYYDAALLQIEGHEGEDDAPLITPNRIRFNGAGEAYGDTLGHETFCLDRLGDGSTECCKTALKPYDLAVCAVLILAAHHFGDAVYVASDGDPEDWQPALDFVRSVFPDRAAALDFPPNITAEQE